MKAISIPNFTSTIAPDDKPSIAVYGIENVGTTRFGCTAPCSGGYLGVIALDKNTKRTVEAYQKEWGLAVVVNQKPYISDKDALGLARLDCKDQKKDRDGKTDLDRIITIYTDAVARITDDISNLVSNRDVESVVVDQASQLYDYILFSHFGRKNQIESFSRAAPNQDMIDIVNMLRNKNSVLVHKATEIWKDTGEKDFRGNPKQAPSGQFKPEGFGKIGKLVTAVVELSSRKLGAVDGDDKKFGRADILKKKYRCKVVTCKGNTLLEGRDLGDQVVVNEEGEVVKGVSGEDIGWANVMAAIGVEG